MYFPECLRYTAGSSDAADIGDFYQWGRVADGHQNTVWYKGIDHRDSIGTSVKWSATNDPVADGKTSGVVAYSDGANTYDVLTHQVTGNKVGKFISAGSANADGNYDWYYNSGHDKGLWGTTTNTRADAADVSKTVNDPCPSGWKVPSQFNWWDSYKGTGSDALGSSDSYANATNNTWQWRGLSTNGGAIGGALITNAAGERVFLPAAGRRNYSDGKLTVIDTSGYYWSSTCDNTGSTFHVYLNSTLVLTGSYGLTSITRAEGILVRCVAE